MRLPGPLEGAGVTAGQRVAMGCTFLALFILISIEFGVPVIVGLPLALVLIGLAYLAGLYHLEE